MTREQLKKRFMELEGLELGRGAPSNYARRAARQRLLKELMATGVSNAEAVYQISKAEEKLCYN